MPFNRPFRFIFIIFAASTIFFSTSCKQVSVDSGLKVAEKTIKVNLNPKEPFQLPIRQGALRYVKLETSRKCLIAKIDQIFIYRKTVYILDKENCALLLFTLSGKFLKKQTFLYQKLLSFDILNDSIYLMEKQFGNIYKLTLEGAVKNVFRPGLRGVQFLAISDSMFLYNTAGLRLADDKSGLFQLVSADKNGVLTRGYLPNSKNFSYMPSYYFSNQLTRSNEEIWFTTNYYNAQYHIIANRISELYRLDFGTYNLPKNFFMKKRSNLELSHMPYVTDLACSAQIRDTAFYSFTINGETGYVLLNKKTKAVIKAGVGFLSSAKADFNNLIPLGSYEGSFFSIVNVQSLLEEKDKSINFYKQFTKNDLKNGDNPFLVFYSI